MNMKSLNLLFAAAVISAGALALPLSAHAEANNDGDGGAGSRGEWRAETFPVDESKGPFANAPLTADQLEHWRAGAAASVASVKSDAK